MFKRNIKLFYLLALFDGLAYIYDLILVIYYQSFGLSLFQVGIIFSVLTVTSFLLEIPSGAFADLYGKKKSLIISSLFFFLSFVLIVLFPTFSVFLIAAFLLGTSLAFHSGAQQALLYDSLHKLKRKGDYLKINSRLYTLFLGTTIFTAFFGPYLYAINKSIPIALSAIFSFLYLILTLFLYEEHKPKLIKNFLKEHYNQIKRSTIFIIAKKRLCWLILFSSLSVLMSTIIGDMIATPYYLDLGFLMKEIAIIEVIATVIQTLFTFKADFFERKLGENKSVFLIVVGTSLTLILTLFIKSYFMGFIFGLFWAFMAFRDLFMDNYINQHLDKTNRATVHSIHSMFTSLSATLMLPLAGLFADRYTTISLVKYLAIFYLCLGLILVFYKYYKKF